MSEAKPQQEPSMEEILASIRRIISEDGEEVAQAKPEEPAPEPAAAEDDVLELTDVVAETPEPEPAEEDEMAAAMEALDSPAEEEEELPGPPAEAPDPESLPKEDDEIELREELAAAAAAASPPPDLPEGSALISDEPAATATASLTNLVAAVDRAHATPIGQAGRTIEDLVKEVMRPMIREWLDANLPGLVERLVAREISRLGRHAEGED